MLEIEKYYSVIRIEFVAVQALEVNSALFVKIVFLFCKGDEGNIGQGLEGE